MVVWPCVSGPETSASENRLRCLAIVPAFNERAAIASVIEELRAIPWLDVVVIDDGSGDGTAAEAVRAGARVITLPFNLGIGTAVQTGYLIAQDSGYDIAIQVDGDGQHPPSEIAVLVAALQSGEADLVIGSRFLEVGTFRSTRGRRIGIALLARIVSLATRSRLTDTTSGFRAAGPRAIALFAAAYPHDYPEVESVVVAHRAGLRVREIPIQMHERKGGRSSITPVRSLYYMIKVSMAIGMVLLRRPVRVPGAKS
jgi:glycosyltransferase involved in cell wall biosynthesis